MFVEGVVEVFLGGSPFLSVLLALFFLEEIILFLAVLAGQGSLSIVSLLLYGYIGVLVIDFVWFFIGMHWLYDVLRGHPYLKKGYKKASVLVDRLSHHNHYLVMFISKFIFGTRIFVMMFLGSERCGVLKFLWYNALANLIWLSFIVSIGFGVGKGIALFTSLYENFTITLLIAAVVMVGLYYIQHKIVNWAFGVKLHKP
ncbi:MAG: membrane protein DedA with SNARE-associated domain [Patescibacteria group bacterium]|jgi:membrane protein DedA with SNARE-associated domain